MYYDSTASEITIMLNQHLPKTVPTEHGSFCRTVALGCISFTLDSLETGPY